MIFAAYAVLGLTLLLCFVCVVAFLKRRNWENENVVHLPFLLAVIGMACGGILSIPMVVCAWDGDWMFALFAAFVLVCDCMMLGYLNCVIRYDETGFAARNLLGITRHCGYNEVEGIRAGKDRWVYVQGHSILVDGLSNGGDEFVQAVEKGYRRATGKRLPCFPSFKRKWDPMNGHVDYPWFLFIMWIVMGLFCVALPVMILYSMTAETNPEDIVVHTVQFRSYQLEDGALKLYIDTDETPFEIGYYRHYGEALPEPGVLCNGETYSVGVEKDGHYVVSLTGADGTQYITPDAERQVYRDSQRFAVWLCCIGALIGLWGCYMGIAVARHPERYSEKVRRLFYKDGFLHET